MKESTNGLTDLTIAASGIMEIYRASVFTNGQTEGVIKETGSKILCMGAENIIGKTVEFMQAST